MTAQIVLQDPHRHPRPARAPRGIAVLLALVAVGAAVTLALALSSTRDQSVATSSSLLRAAAVRASAAGSADLACALIDRYGLAGFDASGAATTPLFGGVRIGAMNHSASVVDLATGTAITDDTIAIRILATSELDSTRQTVSVVGRLVQPDTVARADLDLSEFGLLATRRGANSVAFEQGSSLGVWRTAPLAELREPVLIGSATLDADAVSIASGSLLRGYAVLQRHRFAPDDRAFAEECAQKRFSLPDAIHVPESPRPGGSESGLVLATSDASAVRSALDPQYGDPMFGPLEAKRGNLVLHGDLEIRGSGGAGPVPPGEGVAISWPLPRPTSSLGAWRQIDVSGDLRILAGADLAVTVPTLLIVRGDVRLDEGSISVQDGVPFTLIVFGSLSVANSSCIGKPSATRWYDRSGGAAYPRSGASDLIVFGTMDGGDLDPDSGDRTPSDRTFEFDDLSSMHGQIYAPTRHVAFTNGAVLYGRALGYDFRFDNASRFYYDPALNTGRGWSNPLSGIYAADGHARAEILSVTQLADASLTLATGESTGSQPPIRPNRQVVAIDAPVPGVICPVHTAFAGGDAGSYITDATAATADVTTRERLLENPTPDVLRIAATARDFNEARAPGGHPDFDARRKHEKQWVHAVQATLAASGRPAYGAPVPKSQAWYSGSDEVCWSIAQASDIETVILNAGGTAPPVTDADGFGAWFADREGQNLSAPVTMTFARTGDVYQLETGSGFVPLQGRLLGDLPALQSGGGHAATNANFTLEMGMSFVRDTTAPQFLKIATPNDAWIFVNGLLVAELGSRAGAPWNSQAVEFGRLPLSNGEVCEVRIYFAQRGDAESALHIVTNVPMWQSGAPTISDPAASKNALDDLATRVRAAKASGVFSDVPLTYEQRTGGWMRQLLAIAGGGGESAP